MQKNRLKKVENVAEILKLLSTPRRLLLVCLLMESEKCVNELMEELGTTLGNISQHLNALETAGIIKKRREGVQIFCSLSDKRVAKIVKLLHELCCPELIS